MAAKRSRPKTYSQSAPEIFAHVGDRLPRYTPPPRRRHKYFLFALVFTAIELTNTALLLADALGVKERAARKFWREAEALARSGLAASDEPQPPTADQEQAWREQTDEERSRLMRASASIALSPTLLADMEGFVHDLGVVGEGASVRAVYLTASSRLCRQGALCLLRRGAAAGGKNYLVAKTLILIPEASVIHLSSGSPLSLVYYGGSAEDALKYKVIYIPEAAALAERNGVESPITFMLRTLISEGRLDHHVTVPQAKGPPIGMHLKRNGPVVVIVTSARQDVEARAARP